MIQSYSVNKVRNVGLVRGCSIYDSLNVNNFTHVTIIDKF